MNRVCSYCDKVIRNPTVNQHYHRGRCRIMSLKEIARRYAKKYEKVRKWRRDSMGHGGAALPCEEYRVDLIGWSKRIYQLWTL